METDTKPNNKTCSKCGEIKIVEKFKPVKKSIRPDKNTNIDDIHHIGTCKDCRNKQSRDNYKNLSNIDQTKKCNSCEKDKNTSDFIKNRNICKLCNNEHRRNKYVSDEDHRKKLIETATIFKKRKSVERATVREETQIKLEAEIGQENAICKYCNEIKPKSRFRFNRLKCADCERDEPLDKFKRMIRTRVYIALHSVKEKHTIDYLGCSTTEYVQWIQYNSDDFTIENHGKKWHIDHVIPLSKFNLADVEEQMVAFNWRNTTALSAHDNLSKNNKILQPQIEYHIQKLITYHNNNNIELPQIYTDLFAKYLDAGKPLKLSLPLCAGNGVEELS